MITKKTIQEIKNNSFVRNVATLAIGTAGAQIIAIACSPVITRLYTPEALGILGVFMAFVGILAPISALSYPIAIVLAKEDREAKGIVQLSVCISLIFATIFLVIIFISGDLVLKYFGNNFKSSFIILIPIYVLFLAWVQIGQQWLIRKKQFHISAKAVAIRSFLVNFAKIALGVLNPLAIVLIVVTTLGGAFHSFILYLGALKYGINEKIHTRSEKQIPLLLDLSKRYYDFPLYRTPQVFINAISQSLPIIMLSAFFGTNSAGFYAICRSALGTPSQLIGKAVGDVFYPRITEVVHKGGNVTRLLIKATLGLAAIGFFPFVLVILFGPWLFGLVFGPGWTVAGEYARWLSVMLFFNFINRPVVAVIPVLGYQKGLMIYEIFSTGTKLLALYVGVRVFEDDIITVAIFSIFGAIAYFVLISWVILSSRYSKKER